MVRTPPLVFASLLLSSGVAAQADAPHSLAQADIAPAELTADSVFRRRAVMTWSGGASGA